jgi:hypothetical protein
MNSMAGTERLYILNEDRNPIPAPSKAEWEQFMAALPLIAETTLAGYIEITTAFTGQDHDYGEEPVPYLFSTYSMVGPDGCDEGSWRTWEDAQAGHRKTVARFQKLVDSAQPA